MVRTKVAIQLHQVARHPLPTINKVGPHRDNVVRHPGLTWANGGGNIGVGRWNGDGYDDPT